MAFKRWLGQASLCLLSTLVGDVAAGVRKNISNTVVIGFIKNPRDFEEGRCSLQLPEDYARRIERYVFLSDYQDRGVIHIDGHDIKLVRVSGQVPIKKVQKGERFLYQYRGYQVSVRVSYVVTGVCAQENESCEVTYYDASLTVARQSAKRTITTKAVCGS